MDQLFCIDMSRTLNLCIKPLHKFNVLEYLYELQCSSDRLLGQHFEETWKKLGLDRKEIRRYNHKKLTVSVDEEQAWTFMTREQWKCCNIAVNPDATRL